MASLPTSRTLERFRKHGWKPCVVERHSSFSNKKNDLFGFIDILAMKGGVLIAVQATSTSNMNARLDKSLALPELAEWLTTGNLFEVWGWAKKGPRGKRKLWTLDRQSVSLTDTNGVTLARPTPYVGESNWRPEVIVSA